MNRTAIGAGLLGCAAVAAGLFVWRGAGDVSGAVVPRAAAQPLASDALVVLTPPGAEQAAERVQREALAPTVKLAATEVAPLGVNEALLEVLIVTQLSGEPLAGLEPMLMPAEVHSWPTQRAGRSRGTLREVPTTGADGRVEFRVPALADYRLRVGGGGMSLADVRVPALASGEQRSLTVELITADDLRFFGAIVADEDGRPLGRARVVVSQKQGSAREPLPVDGGGCFELEAASWKKEYLRVSLAGYADQLIRVVVGHARAADAKQIRMQRVGQLEVIVRGAGEAPLEGVLVRVTTDSYELFADPSQSMLTFPWGLEWSATTDFEGHCELEDLPPGARLTIELIAPRRPTRRELEPVVVRAGETTQLDFQIGTGVTLRGVLLDQYGEPAGGKQLLIKPATPGGWPSFHAWEQDLPWAATSDDGSFVFEDVEPGTWFIGPAPFRGYRALPLPESVAALATRIEVHEEPAVQSCVLRAWRGLYIRGRVVDPVGAPVSGIILGARQVSGAGVRVGEPSMLVDGVSGPDGTFSVGPLPEGGFELLAASLGSWQRLTFPAHSGDSGLVLRLRAGSSISGAVLDQVTGEPVTARVSVLAVGGEQLRGGSTQLGRFEFQGLGAGTYTLTARTTDGRFGILRGLTLVGGSAAEDLQLVVRRASVLVCAYEGAAENAYFRVTQDGQRVGWGSFGDDRRVELTVPPGQLELQVWRGGVKGEIVTLEVVVAERREWILRDAP